MNTVAQRIHDQIKSQRYKPGQALPDVEELCRAFDSDAATVERAIGDLIYEGILERDPANRDIVRVPKHTLWGTITGNHSFTREARKRNMVPGVNILTFVVQPAWHEVQERLQLQPGEEVIVMERLRTAGGRPLALEFSYMPAKFYPGVTREMFESGGEEQSSFKVMQERFGLVPARAVDEVTVAALEKREAELFGMDEGTPVLIRFRVTLSDKGIPIKGSRAIYLFKAGYELDI
ncbi:MAG: GntR family transcriptional regulator [Bacillota bacterium]